MGTLDVLPFPRPLSLRPGFDDMASRSWFSFASFDRVSCRVGLPARPPSLLCGVMLATRRRLLGGCAGFWASWISFIARMFFWSTGGDAGLFFMISVVSNTSGCCVEGVGGGGGGGGGFISSKRSGNSSIKSLGLR